MSVGKITLVVKMQHLFLTFYSLSSSRITFDRSQSLAIIVIIFRAMNYRGGTTSIIFSSTEYQTFPFSLTLIYDLEWIASHVEAALGITIGER